MAIVNYAPEAVNSDGFILTISQISTPAASQLGPVGADPRSDRSGAHGTAAQNQKGPVPWQRSVHSLKRHQVRQKSPFAGRAPLLGSAVCRFVPCPAFRAAPLHRGSAKLVGSARETPAVLRTDQCVVRFRRRRQSPASNALMTIRAIFAATKHEPLKPDSGGGGLSTPLDSPRGRSVRRAPTAG